MPDNRLEQTLLDRGTVDKGNASIAALQAASQAQQQGGSQGLIQHLIAMLRGQPQQSPAAPMSATEVQHAPDVNLPDESAGAPVGLLHSIFAGSQDPAKDKYMRSVRERQHIPPTPDEQVQEMGARTIFGGDEDDPRWAELIDRKRNIGMRQYPPAMLGK